MGALPPRGQEWTLGKTAATIRFVEDAEELLQSGNLNNNERGLLTDAIAQAKTGTLSFSEWTTPKEYLARHSN